ncbi:MAG: CRISPR-associated helicase Cas3', partial [Candidatus Poribacteria bacterium]|nr:CRISPR-associated helicase Cas3' [Candidatus Poribacteria bacterium]
LAQQENIQFPRKLIYTTPMRVLAKNFYDDFQNTLIGRQEILRAAIQTGENQDDRQFRSDLIFTTIDQVLSSFLNIPYSLGLRQGNVNAGAIVGSYLVFDEFHLFDPDTSLGTVIEMLKMLNGITPFLLMTATFSRPLLERLSEYFDAEVVPVTAADLKHIPSQQGKRREYQVVDQALANSTDAIIDRHQQRSIVICNTVARAQEMYQSLQDNPHRGKTEVLLLHSRFLKKDRKAKEDTIRRRFKRDAKPDDIILVATQVIEVGLDISCENLHTELAPASAILQRAGRCARFENECGTVTIYPIPPTCDGSPNYAPYNKEICEATMEAFRHRNGDVLGFVAEQEIINKVHRTSDQKTLEQLQDRDMDTRDKMSQAISNQELGLASELIRGDDSRILLVHDLPETLDKPFRVEGFSLYRGTLFRAWVKLQQAAQEKRLSWSLKYPVEVDDDSPNSRTAIVYQWREVKKKKDLSISPLFVVHPKLVTYNTEIGFHLEVGETPSPLSVPDDETTQEDERSRGYYRETYTEHIRHLLNAYQSGLAAELSYAASKLERKFRIPEDAINQAVQLCIALHDVGKLTLGWQDWAHKWQQEIGEPVDENYMAAHTDYNRNNPEIREIERTFSVKRPGHAVESVWAIAPLFVKVFGREQKDLAEACFSAIARHHSPRSKNCSSYTLHSNAPSEIKTVLNVIGGLGQDTLRHLESICKYANPIKPFSYFVQAPNTRALLLYFLIVRALRLADQEATSKVSRRE